MKNTVFFSWQSDHPSKVCRNFIENAANTAIKNLKKDVSLEEPIRNELAIDKDTKGVSGSPAIFDTILKKIDAATIFLPDLTFTGVRPDKRLTPNPNVLIEYGYALKSLKLDRIVAVMNEAYGKPTKETMPFNMAHLRYPITYNLPEHADAALRKEAEESLVADLINAFKSIFANESLNPPAPLPTIPQFQPKAFETAKQRFCYSPELIGVRWDELPGHTPSPTPVGLEKRPALWLGVAPTHQQDRKWSPVELREAARRPNHALMPFSRSDISYLRASDGFGVYNRDFSGNNSTGSVAFAFTSGEIWSASTVLLSFEDKIFLAEIVDEFSEKLAEHADFLLRLNISGPYRWSAAIDGVKNYKLVIASREGHSSIYSQPICLLDSIVTSGTYQLGKNPKHVLRPFFEEICSASGRPYPDYDPFV